MRDALGESPQRAAAALMLRDALDNLGEADGR
jgi:hypothetical protein